MGLSLVVLSGKESKAERFERLELARLATRREVTLCSRCRYRPTSRASGQCRACDR